MTPRRRAAGLTLAIAAVLSSNAFGVITYTIQGTNWPADRRAAAEASMEAAVARYNAFGGFNKHINVYYNTGVATADGNYNGTIRFGGTFPNERVTLHEMAHTLGVGTTSNYANLMTGGTWDGPRGIAIVKQFDGLQATLNGDGAHLWPYGLNFDNEGSAINNARHVAVTYAVRGDMGIGPTAHPSTATTVALTATNALGTSGFNYSTGWSDGYFAHAGASYSTGAFAMRTPASVNSFDFAGDSLMLNNGRDPLNGGLYYKGAGTTGIISFKNLILQGGTIHHLSGAADLFQLDGKVTVTADSLIRAEQGSINILADVTGGADITIANTPITDRANGYVRFLSSNNTFTGDINVTGRFELADRANHRFVIGADGVSNAIRGATAKAITLNGLFEIDLTGASETAGDSWTLVDAPNETYGRSFSIGGFTPSGTLWKRGDYVFSTSTGVLSVVPVIRAWAATGSGDFNTASAWSTNSVPNATHSILLGNAITEDATITIAAGSAVAATTLNTTRTYTINLAPGGPTAFRAGALNLQAGRLALASGGDNTLRASGLAIAATGATLDLSDNAMILDYSGASPIAAARAMLASGQITGAVDTARRIGFGEASMLLGATGGSFGNEAVTGDAVLFKLTFAGDANLNGIVNFQDLVALAQNYNEAGSSVWTDGDFNYDASVNFADLVTLAQNYNRGVTETGALSASFQADWAMAQSLVPEPATLAMVLTLGGSTLWRRRPR